MSSYKTLPQIGGTKKSDKKPKKARATIDTGITPESKKKLEKIRHEKTKTTKDKKSSRDGSKKRDKSKRRDEAPKIKSFDLKQYKEESVLGPGCYGEMTLYSKTATNDDDYGGKSVVLVQTMGVKPKEDSKETEKEIMHLLLSHPNLAKCYGVCFTKTHILAVLQPAPDTMMDLLTKMAPLELHDIRFLGSQLLEALVYLAEKKVVNQNINPCNIMVVGPEDDKSIKFMTWSSINLNLYRLKLSDFAPPNASADEEVVQKFRITKYRAPELQKANIKNRKPLSSTDIFSVGMVLLDMAAGEENKFDDCKGRLSYPEVGKAIGCLPLAHTITTMVKPEQAPRTTALKALERDFFADTPLLLCRFGDEIQCLEKHADYLFVATKAGLLLKVDAEEQRVVFAHRLLEVDEDYYEESEDPKGYRVIHCNDHYFAHLDKEKSQRVFIRTMQDLHCFEFLTLDFEIDDLRMNDKFMFVVGCEDGVVELYDVGRRDSHWDLYARVNIDLQPDNVFWGIQVLEDGPANFIALQGHSDSHELLMTHCSVDKDGNCQQRHLELGAEDVTFNALCLAVEPDLIWLSCGQSRNIYLISIESGEVMDQINLDSEGDREVEEMMLVKNRYLLLLTSDHSLSVIDTHDDHSSRVHRVPLRESSAKRDFGGVDPSFLAISHSKVWFAEAGDPTGLRVMHVEEIGRRIKEDKRRRAEKE